jgi:preprotein translocase subunit SecY
MYGGQNTHLPIQVNMAGVMPIIFASSILSIPSTILAFMGNAEPNWFTKILNLFSYEQPLYVVLYLLLIVFFAYFYVTIQYNPVEMANNLRKNSGVIPGLRPGRPTSDFIGKVISKITLVGAMFLGVMAVLPIIVGSVGGMNVALGGTSILILVGVALDTVKSIESQMMMRYYKGFLD